MDYGRTVVNTEWPAVAARARSDAATQAFRVALDRAVGLHTVDSINLATRGQIVALLLDTHANRETRTFQVTGLPVAIWCVLIAMALVLDGVLLLAGTEVRSHMFLAAAAAGSTAAALVLLCSRELSPG